MSESLSTGGTDSSSWMNSYDYVCWEWQRGDGGFSPFHPDVSYYVESAFMAGGIGHYAKGQDVIDFKTMTTQVGGKWPMR